MCVKDWLVGIDLDIIIIQLSSFYLIVFCFLPTDCHFQPQQAVFREISVDKPTEPDPPGTRRYRQGFFFFNLSMVICWGFSLVTNASILDKSVYYIP